MSFSYGVAAGNGNDRKMVLLMMHYLFLSFTKYAFFIDVTTATNTISFITLERRTSLSTNTYLLHKYHPITHAHELPG